MRTLIEIDKTIQRNSDLPVSSLPPEILCKIFIFIRGFTDENQHYPYNIIPHWIKSTTHVCHYWRNVALNCPGLWSHLYFDKYAPGWMELQLERSKNALLSVTLKYQGQKCEKALLDTMWRPGQLQSFCVLESTHDTIKKYMKPLCGVSAPFLQRLVIVLSPPGDPRKPLESLAYDLFSGGTPSLRELQIHGDALPFTSPIFKGLHTLILRTPACSSISLSEFLSALDGSPDLKVVDIEFKAPKILPHAHRSRAVSLPNLETLRLRSALTNCSAILQHFSLPISAKIDIFTYSDGVGVLQAQSDIKGFASAIEQACLSGPLLTIDPTIMEVPSIRSLDYNHHNADPFLMAIWLHNRDGPSLCRIHNNPFSPIVQISSRSTALMQHLPQLVREFSMDHLESVSIGSAPFLIWNFLVELPSLKSLCLNEISAPVFFDHVLHDPALRRDAYDETGDAATTSKHLPQVTVEEEDLPPPLTRFKNLINIGFVNVDFGYMCYAEPTGWVTHVPVDFDVELLEYLKFRKRYGVPIQQAIFNSCINFTGVNHEAVKTYVEDVVWDGEVEMRGDEDMMESLEGDSYLWCEWCGELGCIGRCEE